MTGVAARPPASSGHASFSHPPSWSLRCHCRWRSVSSSSRKPPTPRRRHSAGRLRSSHVRTSSRKASSSAVKPRSTICRLSKRAYWRGGSRRFLWDLRRRAGQSQFAVPAVWGARLRALSGSGDPAASEEPAHRGRPRHRPRLRPLLPRPQCEGSRFSSWHRRPRGLRPPPRPHRDRRRGWRADGAERRCPVALQHRRRVPDRQARAGGCPGRRHGPLPGLRAESPPHLWGGRNSTRLRVAAAVTVFRTARLRVAAAVTVFRGRLFAGAVLAFLTLRWMVRAPRLTEVAATFKRSVSLTTSRLSLRFSLISSATSSLRRCVSWPPSGLLLTERTVVVFAAAGLCARRPRRAGTSSPCAASSADMAT